MTSRRRSLWTIVWAMTVAATLLSQASAPAGADEGPRTAELVEQLRRARQHLQDGELPEADDLFAACVPLAEQVERADLLEVALDGRFRCLVLGAEHVRALEVGRRLLAVQTASGASARAARTRADVGGLLVVLGEYEEAAPHLERAAADLARDESEQAAYALTTLVWVYAARGAYARALETVERAERIAENAEDRLLREYVLHAAATLHLELGEYDRALARVEPYLDTLSPEAAASRLEALAIVGLCRTYLGDSAEALAKLGEALEIAGDVKDAHARAQILISIGEVHRRLRAWADAEAAFREARSVSVSYPREHAWALQGLGAVLAATAPARAEEAARTLDEAIELGERIGDVSVIVESRRTLAELRLAGGDVAAAAHEGQQALRGLEALDWGLTHAEASFSRAHWEEVLRTVVRIALRQGAVPGIFDALEQTRARVLARALGRGRSVATRGLDDDLREEEHKAREAAVTAQSRFLASSERGRRKEVKRARAAWLQALRAYGDTLARLERKEGGGVMAGGVARARIADIQATLDARDRLVLYAFLPERAGALVVGAEDASWVDLPEAQKLRADLATLASSWAKDGPDRALAERVADRLLVPLGLPKDTERLVVSPDGPVAVTPIAWLLDVRRDVLPRATVTYVPSATVHAQLRGQASRRGEGVLALGDPTYVMPEGGHAARLYGGSRLNPLPESRREVLDLIVPGDVKLLGPAANETALRVELARRPRWRAVHLACHGTVNDRIPTLSALALSPTETDDGFLTAAEVVHYDLPADLVALSACESGLGRDVGSEGTLGLVRAFLVAGAPRVLASLARVDDAATRKLMTAFYATWRKGDVSAAEALRQAQATVRGVEGSTHYAPRYWAPWVLWGLD